MRGRLAEFVASLAAKSHCFVQNRTLARPKRFELLTPRFVVWCSIQLSYGRFVAAAGHVRPAGTGRRATGRTTARPGNARRYGKVLPAETVNPVCAVEEPQSGSGTGRQYSVGDVWIADIYSICYIAFGKAMAQAGGCDATGEHRGSRRLFGPRPVRQAPHQTHPDATGEAYRRFLRNRE